MSHTYRKRMLSFEEYYAPFFNDENFWFASKIKKYGKNWRNRLKAQYYGKTEKFYAYNLPKHFRKSVNRKRRRSDNQKIELLKFVDYDEVLFDPWNCKTSDSWEYW